MTSKRGGEPKRRPYRKRKRAQAEEETRRRITEAAVELHGTVGPANTKVTEVAELAGVSRMTVYNHFPTEADLFRACSSHWERQNPFPDPESWLRHQDPALRLERALEELYRWYDQKQDMLGKVLRDAPLLPSLRELMEGHWEEGYMEAVVDALSRGWSGGRERREGEEDEWGAQLRASLRVSADFHTWRTLTDCGMDSAAAAQLAARMVQGAHATAAAPA